MTGETRINIQNTSEVLDLTSSPEHKRVKVEYRDVDDDPSLAMALALSASQADIDSGLAVALHNSRVQAGMSAASTAPTVIMDLESSQEEM